MNIEELLEQYFEGQTSAEEEATLRRFFTSGDVPDNLAMYKSLFVYFDNQISTFKINDDATLETSETSGEISPELNIKPTQQTSKKFVLWLCGAAACAAILIGSFLTNIQSKKCPMEGNYVIIDGRCYTDANTIRSAALNIFRDISEDDSDFTEDDTSAGTKQIIDNQLKEFGSLFDE